MKRVALTLLLAVTATPIFAQAPSAQLSYVLKQMDTGSKKFQRATADFKWDMYERIVKDTTTQTGSIYFERSGSSTEMGALVYNPGNSKPERVLSYKSGTLQMFEPATDQITMMQAGSNQAKYESFLTLGFGGSGTDLAAAWNIADLGPETLSDGSQQVKTEKLDLTSKSGDKTFSHITIWVDPVRDVSLKQVFYAPGGDIKTATYSNIKVNGNVHKDKFEIKKDKNTTVIHH